MEGKGSILIISKGKKEILTICLYTQERRERSFLYMSGRKESLLNIWERKKRFLFPHAEGKKDPYSTAI
jgi:hypothetical protein